MTETKSKAADQVAELLALASDLEVGGQKVSVRPFKFGEFPKVVALAAPLMKFLLSCYALATKGDAAKKGDAATPQGDADTVDIDLAPVEKHGENLFTLCAMLTGKPEEWVRGLDMDDAVKLCSVIVLVNADFFSRRVLPAAMAVAERLGVGKDAETPPASPESSSALSAPATA